MGRIIIDNIMIRLHQRAMPDHSIKSETLEALKWLAFFFMAIDHLYRFTPLTQLEFMLPLGRLAMPLFAFTFGYSLTNFTFKNAQSVRMLLFRLLITALISSIPYIYLQSSSNAFGIWPLNIIFTFFLAVLILYINTWKKIYSIFIAAALFITGGMVVEFFWAGLLLTISSYYFAKRPNWKNILLIVFSLTLLIDLNGNFYALLFLPIVYFAPYLNVKCRRVKHIFYLLYPLHLFLLSGLKFLNN